MLKNDMQRRRFIISAHGRSWKDPSVFTLFGNHLVSIDSQSRCQDPLVSVDVDLSLLRTLPWKRNKRLLLPFELAFQ